MGTSSWNEEPARVQKSGTAETRASAGAVVADPIPLVDLKAQYASIASEIDAAVNETLTQCDFVLGKGVRQFEEKFAAFCGVPYCVGVGSGTEALHVACRALGIGRGDEVIVPAFTFVASALGVTLAGGMPVLVDVDPRTALIDPEKIEEAITERTKAIIVVHIFGQCGDMGAVRAIAREHGLAVIEDAAQAHGATFEGNRAGAMGDVGCFSFYPGKNLGAYGDGGAVTTDDPAIYRQLQLVRNLGSIKKFEHERVGVNSRLDTMQARILSVKLKYLIEWNQRRREIAGYYTEALSGWDVQLPHTEPDREHVYHLYVVLCEDRDKRLAQLHQAGIGAGIHYPAAVHELEVYRDLGYRPGDFPQAERFARHCLSLPLFPELTCEQADRVLHHFVGLPERTGPKEWVTSIGTIERLKDELNNIAT